MGLTDWYRRTFTPTWDDALETLERLAAERNAVIPAWKPGVDNFWPYVNLGGNGLYPMPLETYHGNEEEQTPPGGAPASQFLTNVIVFACLAKRMKLFSEARPRYRRFTNGKPGDIWGDATLDILNHPWPGAATGDLLARAIQDVDLVGNFYCIRRRDTIHRLVPWWVSIILDSPDAADARVMGYRYDPGGPGGGQKPVFYQRGDVAHFAPYPDPTARFRGMSWLTPIAREIAADSATTSHKLEFFRHAATPNMIVKRGVPAANESFTEWVSKMREASEGSQNAYKTFYMSQGADATVVGKDFQQIELAATQGAGEVRIIAASGLHPVIVGVSESLQGSSLNSGNFGAARRLTADTFLRPDWRNFFSSMETIVPPPAGSQLYYDDHDIPFLREDNKDAAEIQQIKATSISLLIRDGFTPESVIKAAGAEDWSLLKHTGMLSVQLQDPNAQPPAPADGPPNGKIPATNGKTPPAEAKTPTRSELLDYLLFARSGEPDYLFTRYDPSQPRVPKGDPDGGEWKKWKHSDPKVYEHEITGVAPLFPGLKDPRRVCKVCGNLVELNPPKRGVDEGDDPFFDRYSPDQPRVPKGNAEGGQFSFAGGKPGLSYDKLTTEALAGGFSVTTHGDVPMGGYMVSPYSGAEEKFDVHTMTRADVHRYRDQHAKQLSQPDHYLGGWRDGDTVYLDIAVHTDSAAKAKRLSEEHHQLAYFDLSKGESVYLNPAPVQ